MSLLIQKNLVSLETVLHEAMPRELVLPKNSRSVLIAGMADDTRIILEEGAQTTFILTAKEGWAGRPKLNFDFHGSNSDLMFLGFIVGTDKRHFDFETVSHHGVPSTNAHYYVRAAMFDTSRVDYKGTLIVEKTAQITNAYLAHHTLLLSDGARARTVPSLEIEADDVKAGHAATIGKVDQELMFYCRSRGIDQDRATRMLIEGFFELQIAMIPDEPTRDIIRKWLVEILPFPSFESYLFA